MLIHVCFKNNIVIIKCTISTYYLNTSCKHEISEILMPRVQRNVISVLTIEIIIIAQSKCKLKKSINKGMDSHHLQRLSMFASYSEIMENYLNAYDHDHECF